MKMTESLFRQVLLDLIDENPIACSALLSIAKVEFTREVPTLAVTLEEHPVLKVNPDFCARHLHTETDAQSVILHEFLHVLLNHTERFKRMDPGLNLALDAVINHIIQRSCGEAYGDFFRRYYAKASGMAALLVPLRENAFSHYRIRHWEKWNEYHQLKSSLMTGRVVVDDVLDVVREVEKRKWSLPRSRVFIGGHEPAPKSVSDAVKTALNRTLREMNGDGIFRSPRAAFPGEGAVIYAAKYRADSKRRRNWERSTLQILRDFVTPDRKARMSEQESRTMTLPVLHAADRRGFIRSLWSPLIPDIQWEHQASKPIGTCQVYLDVSGSMNAEMEALVSLLNRLRGYLRRPFWAFSNEVKPALIEKGILRTETSGGTAMNCVLEHVVATRPGKAVVITDGYIETCDSGLLGKLAATNQSLFAIVSRDGSTHELESAGIPCRQLETYPGDEP